MSGLKFCHWVELAMLQESYLNRVPKVFGGTGQWGVVWLVAAVAVAGIFFIDGIGALLEAWQTPEYSHGPIIPVLSMFLFLRHLKRVPVNHGPVTDRWPGFILLAGAILIGAFGRLIQIPDIVAYALILWVGALLLTSFGWRTGRQFWPAVLHLVYMLPLPGALYYGISTKLQAISSELGVLVLRVLNVPVFLEGNIIDLGVFKLQVAEACSGLNYLFPILSFSYVFSVLYRGPVWHKAVLLIAAVPITVAMNSLRIGLAGYIVNNFGIEWIEGFTHFFEGWVIFLACIILLFILARVMLLFQSEKMSLIQALDLDTSGLAEQMKRIRFVRPSAALISGVVLMTAVTGLWNVAQPERQAVVLEREPFVLFPRRLDNWVSGPQRSLEANVARVLGADDYVLVEYNRETAQAPVDLFVAWYKDQSVGGTHSPEVCLPAGGWEIAALDSKDISSAAITSTPFSLNRAIIQKGVDRMMVYYWYEQNGKRTASDFTAKLQILSGKLLSGREDSSLIRLTTPIISNDDARAEARLDDMLARLLQDLPRFVPGA